MALIHMAQSCIADGIGVIRVDYDAYKVAHAGELQMSASETPPASDTELDDRLQNLMKEIHDEHVPERLLELARKLQSALDERGHAKK